MKFNFTYTQSNEIRDKDGDNISYAQHVMCGEIADKLSGMLINNKDCKISEEQHNGNTIVRYEIHIFTPEELKELVRNIQASVSMGIPVIY